ncbi:MAG: hypothetical protein ACAH95_08915 [Fimbriimonas sp.]
MIVLMWALAACAVAQTQPSRTRSENAAIWLRDQLNAELSARIPDAGKSPLADYPFHFVFLVDSSQASAKSAYPEFVKQTLSHFLRAVEFAQRGRGSTSLVSVYPYQTELYNGDPFRVEALPLTENAVREATAKVPGSTIPNLTNGQPAPIKGGHDHSGARRAVLDALIAQNAGVQPGDWTRPVLLIQFTTIDVNESPGDQERDRRIRSLPARTSLLEGTGFQAYDVKGLPLKTDPPRSGLEPFNVYLWTYGPGSFSGIKPLAAKTASAPPAVVAAPATDYSKLVIWLVVLVAIAAAAYLLRGMLMKTHRVTIHRGAASIYGRDLKRGERVEIWGPGSQSVGVGALVLPADAAPGVPAQKLATMRLEGSSLILEPQVFDVATPGRVGGGSLTISPGKKTGFQLVRENVKTQMLHVSLS